MRTPHPPAAKRPPRRGRLLLKAALVVGLVASVWQTFGPNPPLEVSAATTRITAPLRPDGTPDYGLALLEASRGEAPPGRNAAVPLLAAFWPSGDVSNLMPLADCRRLITELRAEALSGDAFSTLNTPKGREAIAAFLEKQLGRAVSPAAGGEIDHTIAHCEPVNRPWTSEDLPFLARWVARNARAYERIHEASRRPAWHWPPTRMLRGEPGAIGQSLPALSAIRDAGRKLSTRCNYYRGSGRYALAAEDALAILRLAGHLQSDKLVANRLIGFAVEGVGLDLVEKIASEARTDRETLGTLACGLRGLCPIESFAESMNTADRYVTLDLCVEGQHGALEEVADHAEAEYERLLADSSPDGMQFQPRRWQFLSPSIHAMATSTRVDWNVAMREINALIDRIVTAWGLPRAQRSAEFQRIDAESSERAPQAWNLRTAWRASTPAGRGRLVADVWASLYAVNNVRLASELEAAQDRRRFTELHVAFHGAYAETDVYPGSLDELPAQWRLDDFAVSDEEFPWVYERTDSGFTLQPKGAEMVGESSSDDEDLEPWPWKAGGWMRERSRGVGGWSADARGWESGDADTGQEPSADGE